MNIILIRKSILLCGLMMVLTGCGGGGGSSNEQGDTTEDLAGRVVLSGAISATEGQDYGQLSLPGSRVQSRLIGATGVGAGVPVELIEVDDSGNKVGAAIASTVTDDNGHYSLTAPASANFTAGTQYVVRVGGDIATQLDVRVTVAQSTTASDPDVINILDIDPVSDAVSELLTALPNNTTTISVDEIGVITDEVSDIAQGVDTTSATTDVLVNTIKNEAGNDEEVSAIVENAAESGQICGSVSDTDGNRLQDIIVVVREPVNFLKVARTSTDTEGNYCVNVEDGLYIVGTVNRTDSSFSAGEYWTNTGGAEVYLGGEAISVTGGIVTAPPAATDGVNFVLADGVRLEGTVTSAETFTTTSGRTWNAGDPVERVVVEVRTYSDNFPVGRASVDADGRYRINVIPGSYRIGIRNQTRKPFASEFWVSDTSSTSNGNLAMPVALTEVNTTVLKDFDLDRGRRISGLIFNAPGGDAMTGQRIEIDPASGGFGPRLRSNKAGFYRVVVAPGLYNVYARGQSLQVDVSTGHAESTDFDSVVQELPVVVTDKAASPAPVSQAKVYLLDPANNYARVHKEVTNSSGEASLFTPLVGNHIIYVRVDSEQSYATIVHDGQRQDDRAALSGYSTKLVRN